MTKLKIEWTSHFKKDYKKAIKRNLDIKLLNEVIFQLSNGQILDKKYHDHPLSGNWQNFRECHIQPDWLLIYKIENGKLILTLSRTGTHSDFLKK